MRSNRRVTISPGLVSVSIALLAAAAVSLRYLGFIGILIDFILVPAAVMVLVLGWVQPRDQDFVACVLLGLAFLPLVGWFFGRADEYLVEGLISGTGVSSSRAR